ncbi:MAG: branched-chain amino acid aminotransferase [Chitinophagaceae bacterium]
MKNLYPVEWVAKSRFNIEELKHSGFGNFFSDHILVSIYENKKWGSPKIIPYEAFSIMPGNATIHYGQSIFEGMKAFFSKKQDKIGIFRIKDHCQRINLSAYRLAMPTLDEDIFIEGIKQLVEVDKKWVNPVPGNSLYIRPFMFAKDNFLGVRPAENYYFMIITSPVGNYYDKSVKVYVEDEYARAAKGGLGYTKAAANYAASLFPTQRIIKEYGYDQILWTDDVSHEYVQEIGTMNVFFMINNVLVTPDLKDKTILNGITRDSIIKICKKKNILIEERPISKKELLAAYKIGKLTAAFGSGTAAVITQINQIKCDQEIIYLDLSKETLPNQLKQELTNIRLGITEDTFGWMTWI